MAALEMGGDGGLLALVSLVSPFPPPTLPDATGTGSEGSTLPPPDGTVTNFVPFHERTGFCMIGHWGHRPNADAARCVRCECLSVSPMPRPEPIHVVLHVLHVFFL